MYSKTVQSMVQLTIGLTLGLFTWIEYHLKAVICALSTKFCAGTKFRATKVRRDTFLSVTTYFFPISPGLRPIPGISSDAQTLRPVHPSDVRLTNLFLPLYTTK